MTMKITAPKGYELMYETEIPDFAGYGQVFRHVKTGARICTIKNADQNRTFCIGFRTTPTDSTGVPHIIEHSVLCGSDKFPLKDPFMELAKGSLNTFLNAVTYPDKTMYPIASCNLKDFRNLTDVYLDAVFHPAIYHTPEIFRQEGWRYELESPEADLIYNGVVYNEMKGAFSNADDVVERAIEQYLFPDTTYGVESGGDPEVIPELTYENFLKFHSTYYHPSNSYIYFYGDLDMEEQLTWLDERYLSEFEQITVNSEVQTQAPIGVRKEVITYPVGEDEEIKNKTYLSFNVVTGEATDLKRCTAWGILSGVLFNMPGAPVKQALLDAGIGSDISCSFGNYLKQPGFTVLAKEAEADQEDEFVDIIRKECEKLVSGGINKDSLLGIINSSEFRYREQDYGSVSKGLYLFFEMMNSWLYDDYAAFTYAKVSEVFTELKEAINTGYFEQLLKEDLLESNHLLILRAEPEKGLAVAKEKALAEKLAAYKATLSQEELQKLVDDTKALREFQEAEDSEEQKQCLPLLEISDIEKTVPDFSNIETEVEGVKLIYHNEFTNGIAYVKMLFDLRAVSTEDLPYLGLLIPCLGYLNTENYSYQGLADAINIYTGGIDVIGTTYSDNENYREFHPYVDGSVRVLYDELPKGLGLLAEILGTTDFSDTKRLREMVAMGVTRMRSAIEGGGHAAMVSRASSYFCLQDYFKQQTRGLAQFRFLKELSEHFDEKKDELVTKLTDLCRSVIAKELMTISVTCDEAGLELVKQELATCLGNLFKNTKKPYVGAPAAYPLEAKNEGFTYAGQVQYLAVCGSYKEAGLPYTGALKVANTMLSTDYLWNNVRVKGGAYGCMNGFAAINGSGYFVSYRDPKLVETMKVYEGAGDYLRAANLSERERTKFIIGTIGNMDSPRTPREEGDFALNMYISKYTRELLQKERDEVLNVTNEDLHTCGAYADAIIAQGCRAALGAESKMKSEGPSILKSIEPLG